MSFAYFKTRRRPYHGCRLGTVTMIRGVTEYLQAYEICLDVYLYLSRVTQKGVLSVAVTLLRNGVIFLR